MPRVTDPVLLSHLQRRGVPFDEVEFAQDYGKRVKGVSSPYMKRYKHLNSRQEFAVFSGLPMVDADGVKCEPQWIQAGQTYRIKQNVFGALYNDQTGVMTLTCKNDQPDGVRKKNDTVVFSPQLFVNGVEIPRPPVSLLATDPMNPNYTENVLEWNYGVCQRRLRAVEGRIHGYWIFPANPGGEVRIVYNQTGQYRLKLGQYAIDADTEVIPASVFASASYPFEVSDSATYNPDADPETTSVDGYVGRAVGIVETWATIIAGAGDSSNDSATTASGGGFAASLVSPNWKELWRSIFLFDTSGLPDSASISAATLSLYGQYVIDQGGYGPTATIYSSNPASNTALVAADYTTLGSTAYATAIAIGAWSIAGYNDFTLNADGRSAISKTGISKFGFRNANYDVAAVAPTWNAANDGTFMDQWTSEKGAGFKPKLVVTYTVPVTSQASGFWI